MEPSAAGRYNNVGRFLKGSQNERQQQGELPASYNMPQHSRGLLRIIQHFTPSWFSVNTGTGIVSILLHNLPYNGIWLYYISIVVFCLNIFLFLLFTLISISRYAIWPELWMMMIRHPTQPLFIGTFPMALAMITNMVVFVCVPAWGAPAITLAWCLWWINTAIAVTTCVCLPFTIMHMHTGTQLKSMTATWLLPISSAIVASASGGVVADVLPDENHALWTMVISYILWGMSVPLALTVLVIYFQRLTLHHLPAREVIVSVFLPLNPLGQGAYAAMQLGKVAQRILPLTGTLQVSAAGDILYVVGWVAALILWGYGLLWFAFAVASVTRSRFPFNMGWWGFTFPLGTYTVATTTIGQEMPSKFFKVLGTVLSTMVTILWLIVAILTVKGAISGGLFDDPRQDKAKNDEKKDDGENDQDTSTSND